MCNFWSCLLTVYFYGSLRLIHSWIFLPFNCKVFLYRICKWCFLTGLSWSFPPWPAFMGSVRHTNTHEFFVWILMWIVTRAFLCLIVCQILRALSRCASCHMHPRLPRAGATPPTHTHSWLISWGQFHVLLYYNSLFTLRKPSSPLRARFSLSEQYNYTV